jgi:hypothetical protein
MGAFINTADIQEQGCFFFLTMATHSRKMHKHVCGASAFDACGSALRAHSDNERLVAFANACLAVLQPAGASPARNSPQSSPKGDRKPAKKSLWKELFKSR